MNIDDPKSFSHRFATVNGIRLHYVDEGQGPLVLLLHGIPYIWYTWRHQIRALAAAGYRVVVPDFRGFGQSDAPPDGQSYEAVKLVGDLVGLICSLDEKTSATVVGHDLGSRVAHYCAELRPDLFRALVMVNTPVGPRDTPSPSEVFKQIRSATGKRFYHDYIQDVGATDREMNADIRKTLRSILYSVSGSAVGSERWRILIGPKETILDTFHDPDRLPEWLSAQAFDYYVSEYERHGFTPALNCYRCLERNWEQTPFLDGLRPSQPSLFIGGAADPSNELSAPTYNQLESHLPNLRKKVLLEGVGHDAPEEEPETFNRMLLEFLAEV